jgi:lycopene cyclase domain-containing protein
VVGIPFILWDICFTKLGVWWFNYNYTLGYSLAGLPLEEWLFFICIPFACIFTYHSLNKFFDLSAANAFNNIIAFVICILLLVVALLHSDKLYTCIVGVTTTFTLIYLHFIAKVTWIGQASLIFLVLMAGFIPVNGLLTGTGLESPIVNYNKEEFLNIRILTIPVEDFVYGYTQFLLNVYFFNFFNRKKTIGNKI